MSGAKRVRRAGWYTGSSASSVGIEIAVAISMGSVGGYYLEQHVTHWSPWTTIIGFLIGVGAAGSAVVRTAKTYKLELQRIEEDKKRGDER